MKVFRFHHLLLALAALTAYLTSEALDVVHAWLGYTIATMLLARLVLGLLRFRGFEFRRLIPRLSDTSQAARGIRRRFIQPALTLALALCLVATAGSGILMDQGGTLVGSSIRTHDDGRVSGQGLSRENQEFLLPGIMLGLMALLHVRESEEEGEEDKEGLLAELHQSFGNVLLPLAAIHALYLLLFRFEFARFMVFAQRRRS